jgi:hypothetical protein
MRLAGAAGEAYLLPAQRRFAKLQDAVYLSELSSIVMGQKGKAMRKMLAIAMLLLLTGCASSRQPSHDFSGGFVGVSGGGGQTP